MRALEVQRRQVACRAMWKYDDPDAVERSYMFHGWTSVGAAISAVVFLVSGIVTVVVARAQWREEASEARCERIMSALLAADGDDEASLDEVAAEDGVEVDASSEHSSMFDVSDDAEPIGWVSPATESYECT